MQKSSHHGEKHANFAGPYSPPCACRRTQPLQRQDEQHASDQIDRFQKGLTVQDRSHAFFDPLALNILSMRSVMRNPPTMLLVAATMAMVPRTLASVAPCAWYSPASRIAPT